MGLSKGHVKEVGLRMLVPGEKEGKGNRGRPEKSLEECWRSVGWGGKKGDTEMEAKDAELRIRDRRIRNFNNKLVSIRIRGSKSQDVYAKGMEGFEGSGSS